MEPLDYRTPPGYAAPPPPPAPPDNGHPAYLEIHLGRKRRVVHIIGYATLYLAISAVLAWFFFYFSGSWRLAVGLVALMVLYMTYMGRWASKNIERRE